MLQIVCKTLNLAQDGSEKNMNLKKAFMNPILTDIGSKTRKQINLSPNQLPCRVHSPFECMLSAIFEIRSHIVGG